VPWRSRRSIGSLQQRLTRCEFVQWDSMGDCSTERDCGLAASSPLEMAYTTAPAELGMKSCLGVLAS
jgi:hypothetical protein